MRLLCFSDWRIQDVKDIFEFIHAFEERENKRFDALVYAGDDISRFEKDGINYFSELAKLTVEGVVVAVVGNDDTEKVKRILNKEGVVDLHENPYQIRNISFLGLEGSTCGPGIIQYTEKEVKEHLNKQIKKLDNTDFTVLVSHTPPKGILDYSSRFGHKHIGSSGVRDLIDKKRIDLVICGHSHLNGGKHEFIKNTNVINISSHDNKNALGRFCVLEIENNKISNIEFFDTEYSINSHPLKKLYQVGKKRVKQFIAIEINDYSDLTEDNREKLKELPGVSDWHINRWIKEAKIISSGEYNVNREKLQKLIGENYLLYDIETDMGEDKVFMIGIYSNSDDEFIQLTEKDDEEKLLRDFKKILNKYNSSKLISFSNCHFERRVLSSSCEKYNLNNLKKLIEEEIDLGINIPEILLGGFDYNVKDLAKAFGYNFKTDLDGLEVGMAYTKYLHTNEEPDWEEIKKYNRDDVLAIKKILDSLL